MAFQILTTTAASITELKRDPMGTFNAGDGAPVAILNRNEPAFYCVPPALYAHLMDILEDEELGRIAGYRLVYSVEDEIITVTVIGVGKRENDAVYKMTRHRS